jgi:hypothetical protein
MKDTPKREGYPMSERSNISTGTLQHQDGIQNASAEQPRRQRSSLKGKDGTLNEITAAQFAQQANKSPDDFE